MLEVFIITAIVLVLGGYGTLVVVSQDWGLLGYSVVASVLVATIALLMLFFSSLSGF